MRSANREITVMTKVAELLIQLDHLDMAMSKLQQIGVHGPLSKEDCATLMSQLRRDRDRATNDLHHEAVLKRTAAFAATCGG